MFVRSLIGRHAGAVMDLPLHAAQAQLAAGTAAKVTDAELAELDLPQSGGVSAKPEEAPEGYRIERDEEGGWYDVFDPQGDLISDAERPPNLAAARSLAKADAAEQAREMEAAASDRGTVQIPADWSDLAYQEQRAIAVQLVPGTRSKEAITTVIEAELARRDAAA